MTTTARKRLWHAVFDGERQVTKWDLRRDKTWNAGRAMLRAMTKATRKRHKFRVHSRWFIETPARPYGA